MTEKERHVKRILCWVDDHPRIGWWWVLCLTLGTVANVLLNVVELVK